MYFVVGSSKGADWLAVDEGVDVFEVSGWLFGEGSADECYAVEPVAVELGVGIVTVDLNFGADEHRAREARVNLLVVEVLLIVASVEIDCGGLNVAEAFGVAVVDDDAEGAESDEVVKEDCEFA